MSRPALVARVRKAHVLWATGALALAAVAGAAQAVASGHDTGTEHGPRAESARYVVASGSPSATRPAPPPGHPGAPFGFGPGRHPALCVVLDPAAVKAVVAASSAKGGAAAKGAVAAPVGANGAVAVAVGATRLAPCPAGVTAPHPTASRVHRPPIASGMPPMPSHPMWPLHPHPAAPPSAAPGH